MFWDFQSGCCSIGSILSCYITYDNKFVNVNFQYRVTFILRVTESDTLQTLISH